MSVGTYESAPASRPSVLCARQPPVWVQHLLREETREGVDVPASCGMAEWIEGEGIALLALVAPDALELDGSAFRATVESCYATCCQILRSRGRFPLRFWNYVSGIGKRFDNGHSGYEIFNAGRLTVCNEQREYEGFAASRVCATALDVRRSGFILHAVAAEDPGAPVDNPRQVPPHRYSRRYGPVPPAFARAAHVPAALRGIPGIPDAIVSGTASVVGEATRHRGDLEAQLAEIALNLASVVEALRGRKPSWPVGARLPAEALEALTHYRSARLYVPRRQDEARVRDWARSCFPSVDAVELIRADLCRPDLLAEVEGTVSLAS